MMPPSWSSRSNRHLEQETVPPGETKTRPKALNRGRAEYGLQLARNHLVQTETSATDVAHPRPLPLSGLPAPILCALADRIESAGAYATAHCGGCRPRRSTLACVLLPPK